MTAIPMPMKNRIMLKLILILLCVLGCRLATAQSDYVVLTKGDTIFGKVKYLDFGPDKKVQITVDKKRTTYSMLQVRAFFMDNEHYHLVRMYSRYTFMKPLTPDKYLTLYSFQPENQVQWDGRYLAKKDGTGLEIPNIGFKKKLGEFISECPDLSEEITTGDLGRNDISEIVNRFNECVDSPTREAAPPQTTPPAPVVQSNYWNELEAAIKDSQKIDDKETVLEMLNEAKVKNARGEAMPRFLLDGLRKSLEPEPTLQELLTKALADGKN